MRISKHPGMQFTPSVYKWVVIFLKKHCNIIVCGNSSVLAAFFVLYYVIGEKLLQLFEY